MKKIIIFSLVLSFLSACAVDPYTGQSKMSNTAKGGLIGAGAGVLTGIAIDGKKGALKGAIGGAVVGGAVGGYMDIQAKALRQELQGTGVQVQFENDRINLIMPGNITFNTNSADIKSNFYSVLNSVAKVIVKYNKTSVEITGYTDNTGSATTNNKLSYNRANSVASYLMNQKVNQNRIFIQGVGSNNPIASNSTANGREQNRRVEITLRNN